MKFADLELTDLAVDLMLRAERLNNSMSSVVNAVEIDEGSFNIEIEYEDGFLDEDCYLVDTDGNIIHVSSPLGRYKVATLGEDTCDDVCNNLLRFSDEVTEHLKIKYK